MVIEHFFVGRNGWLGCRCYEENIHEGFDLQVGSDGYVEVSCRACHKEMMLSDIMKMFIRYGQSEKQTE